MPSSIKTATSSSGSLKLYRLSIGLAVLRENDGSFVKYYSSWSKNSCLEKETPATLSTALKSLAQPGMSGTLLDTTLFGIHGLLYYFAART